MIILFATKSNLFVLFIFFLSYSISFETMWTSVTLLLIKAELIPTNSARPAASFKGLHHLMNGSSSLEDCSNTLSLKLSGQVHPHEMEHLPLKIFWYQHVLLGHKISVYLSRVG